MIENGNGRISGTIEFPAEALLRGSSLAEVSDKLEGIQQLVRQLDRRLRQCEVCHRDFYHRDVLQPLFNSIAEMLKVQAKSKHYIGKHSSNGNDDRLRSLYEDYVRCNRALLNGLLTQFGLERFEARPGEEFNPESHQALASVATSNESKHRRVARSIEAGYRRDETVVVKAYVALFQIQREEP